MDTERIYGLLLDLVRIPSVSPSTEETRVARLIYDRLAHEPYFAENKEALQLWPIENDEFGRQTVFAFVRAARPTSKTIIMIGHMDVVDASESRELANLAFDPPEYTRELARLSLPDDARKDLLKGDFLFGRGVFDMKCGVAVEVEFIRECAQNLESLEANLLLMLVADEENRSSGMISAIKQLRRLQEDEGLDFVACVNAEGATQKSHEDVKRYISLGTIGKMMPVFYCVGRESHVGSYYEGLNANLLASAVNMVLEGSPEWVDRAGNEVYPPPTALRHRDLRDIYSVTLPARVVTYFNCLSTAKTPAVALEMMKKVASEAIEMTINRLKYSAERFSEASSEKITIDWKPKVVTYAELLENVRQTWSGSKKSASRGSLDDYVASFVDGLPKDMDDRDRSIAVISQVLNFLTDKSPMVVVGFLPPYYPHRTNLRRSQRELGVLDAALGLISEASERFGETLEISEHFTAISDLSYMGFQGERDDLMPLALNTPGWGKVYDLPLDTLLKFDVPVVNIGPSGRDAHKYTERLDLKYYLGAYPKLWESMLTRLSKLE